MGILPYGTGIMLSKNWCIAVAVLALAAFEVRIASASGHGANASHGVGGPAVTFRTGGANGWGNSGQFRRAENGIFGPSWPFGNANWGCGGCGLGYGYSGWGYSPLLLGYDLGGVPYFAQFPPVYYGYEDNMPVLKAPIRSSWAGSESPQSAPESASSADPPRRPLRIKNPYYFEAKADKP